MPIMISVGITAEFNTNVLKRLNKEFNANFNFSEFKHYAFFNKSKSRIEMHLVIKLSRALIFLMKKYSLKKVSQFIENSTNIVQINLTLISKVL